MKLVKKIPLPITGLSLGLAALGNLVQITPKMANTLEFFNISASFSLKLRFILHLISAIIFLALTVKILSDFSSFKNEMNNPVTASVFPTYSMNLMLLAAWLKPYIGVFAVILWYAAILLHVLLIIYFSVKFLCKHELKTVLPSWFIVYVGIAVASVTAPLFDAVPIGQFCFYWGITWTIGLFIVVAIRYAKLGHGPEPTKPLLVICAAPIALCLAGYRNSFPVKNQTVLWVLLISSQATFCFMFFQMLRLLRLPFYPSFSAFTFPIVISGLSAKLALHELFRKADFRVQAWLIAVETLVACLIVFYCLIKYIKAFLKSLNN